ncbi:hypothetical protein [Fredinandcohnia sp. 179-A 10B2 NHS]|uniref:hypothetical protein n=1 Tax=Fredinandcohnia sp. 179-A 10B2 NHS TaxID=3235176 RepID=UPI0039A20C70
MEIQFNKTISRKFIAAAISVVVYAIIMGLVTFSSDLNTFGEYVNDYISTVSTFLPLSFPFIVLYGTLASIISESLGHLLAKYTAKEMKYPLSFTFHVLFGSILFLFSLIASIVFFIVDYILYRKGVYGWKTALKSFVFPILAWVLFKGLTYVMVI